MTKTLLLIATAALMPTQLQAEAPTPGSPSRASALILSSAEGRAGGFQMVSSYCAEGLCERVYERTVQPARRSRSTPQRYIVRIEPDMMSRQMAYADR